VKCSSASLHKQYENNLEALKNSISVFKEGDYKKAIIELSKYHNVYDSTYYEYETVALLAESYVRIGEIDSGKLVYEKSINEILNKVNSKQFPAYSSLALEDLNKWYKEYPDFPNELKFENGFTHLDELPQPIGGLSAIEKKILNTEKFVGKVYVWALIDENGIVKECEIVKTFNESVNERVINAVKTTTFSKPKRKGRISKIWVSIPIAFSYK